MARVIAFVPDLLFGSQLQGALRAAGHQVELAADTAAVRGKLDGADVLVVDLTDAAVERLDQVAALIADGALASAKTLAFYSHVEAQTRALAESAGIDVVVARSRMAREAPELVARLAD
ncbi:MAG TPA: hypothetical protein VHU13_08905 [Solirubrobacteraceae bacterium]|nr:hypothetical protein [Solirubrobacteraceae bacterium]